MPAPVKRKYHRVHIAYLVMILTMKQSLSISDVQKVIPPMDSSEDEVLSVYEDYSEKFRRLALFSTSRCSPPQRVSAARSRAATTPWSCWSLRAP